MKTVEEINYKIRKGTAVVLTASEVKELARTASPKEIVQKVDVVTTATFGPMCSSGAFINVGHSSPGIRMEKMNMNNVPVFGGIAAVDGYIGATEVSPDNPEYGGAHVIEALVRGEEVHLEAHGKGTDCYPAKSVDTYISLKNVNEAYLFNPRNAYQNYRAAVNTTDETKYTYMGILKPNSGNVTFSTTGELSPLLNDPLLRTIGLGTRIWFCGADGYVSWHGTQFNTQRPHNEHGIPKGPSATLALIGDLKSMDPDFIRAAYFRQYGVSLYVGIGVAFPVLDEDIARSLSIQNRDITTVLCDYGKKDAPVIREVTYEELYSGSIDILGKKVVTSPISSIAQSRKIMEILKEKVNQGIFTLTEAVVPIGHKEGVRPLRIQTQPHHNDRSQANTTESLRIAFHPERCIGCGYCTGLCPTKALTINSKGVLHFDTDTCIGCALCAEGCPTRSFCVKGDLHVPGKKIPLCNEPFPFYGL